jgi:O-antigen/teichoic acid export membrane protein
MPLFRVGHEKVFQEKMGTKTEKVVEDMIYVGFGMIIAALCSFGFNILAGRILGPTVYGEFTLIQSISIFVSIPMQMGFATALIKYSAEKDDIEQQRVIISTIYILVFIFANLSLLVYFLFSSYFIEILSIPRKIFQFSVILGLLYVFYTLTTSTLRGLHEMKKYSLFRPVYNILSLLVFLIFFFLYLINLETLVFSVYLAYAATGVLIIVFFIRKYLRLQFDKSWAIRMVRYSTYALIGGVAAIFFTNIDKILIDRFMTLADVGIYGAYYWAFITVSSLVSGVIVTVLFPFASKYEHKEVIFQRLNRIVPIASVLGFPFFVLFGYIVLHLYGRDYPFDLGLALLFCLAGEIIIIDELYVWLMNAVGNKGVRVSSFAAVILAVVNFTLNIALIPLMGLNGAVLAKIISFALGLGIILSRRKYYYAVRGD